MMRLGCASGYFMILSSVYCLANLFIHRQGQFDACNWLGLCMYIKIFVHAICLAVYLGSCWRCRAQHTGLPIWMFVANWAQELYCVAAEEQYLAQWSQYSWSCKSCQTSKTYKHGSKQMDVFPLRFRVASVTFWHNLRERRLGTWRWKFVGSPNWFTASISVGEPSSRDDVYLRR